MAVDHVVRISGSQGDGAEVDGDAISAVDVNAAVAANGNNS